MTSIFRSMAIAAALSVFSSAAIAQSPSYYEGGITPEKYYDGGASDGPLGDKNLERFDELDFDVFSN